jgi:hypothetical protein
VVRARKRRRQAEEWGRRADGMQQCSVGAAGGLADDDVRLQLIAGAGQGVSERKSGALASREGQSAEHRFVPRARQPPMPLAREIHQGRSLVRLSHRGRENG